jgi:putative methionine-R-sulfoxide reductase with GAF domain
MKSKNLYYIHPIANSFHIDGADLTKLLIVHQTIPETIGQYVTTDKNGKDLFEGDKIIAYNTAGVAIGMYVVKRSDTWCGFYMCLDSGIECYAIKCQDNIELHGNNWECVE